MFKYEIDTRILYYLASGLSYREIANKYYSRRKNKVVYEVKRLLRKFKLKNREELTIFAYVKGLIT